MTDTDKISRREQIKIANRQQILQAALTVFAENGLDNSNVRDIIRTSGLSPGTFYNYFQSKEEIFRVLFDEIITDIHNKSRPLWLNVWQKGPTKSVMKSAFEDFFNIFYTNPLYLHFFAKNQNQVREMRHNGRIKHIIEDLQKDIEQAIQKGQLPPFPVKFLTTTLFGAVFEFLAEMIAQPKQISIPDVSENLAVFFRGGIFSLGIHSGSKEITTKFLSLANFPTNLFKNL